MIKRVIISLIFLIIGSAFAGAILERFQAKSENDRVLLEWRTKDEVSLKTFVIERKSINNDFISVGEIVPKGNNSNYQFIDETAFKSAASVYYYRLKIVDSDGSASYSAEISVTHSVSSVKRTWGSIKAMFR